MFAAGLNFKGFFNFALSYCEHVALFVRGFGLRFGNHVLPGHQVLLRGALERTEPREPRS